MNAERPCKKARCLSAASKRSEQLPEGTLERAHAAPDSNVCSGEGLAPPSRPPACLKVEMRRGARTPLQCIITVIQLSSTLLIAASACAGLPWLDTRNAKEASRSHCIIDAVRSWGLIALHARITCAHMRGHNGKCMWMLPHIAYTLRYGTGRAVRPSLYRPRPESNRRPLTPSRHRRSLQNPTSSLDTHTTAP